VWRGDLALVERVQEDAKCDPQVPKEGVCMNVIMLREEREAAILLLESLVAVREHVPPVLFREMFSAGQLQAFDELNESLRQVSGGDASVLRQPQHMLIPITDAAADAVIEFVHNPNHMPKVGECDCANTDPACLVKWAWHWADKLVDIRMATMNIDTVIDDLLKESDG
jgi:hypothetical protein